MKSIFKISLLAVTVAFAVGCQQDESMEKSSTAQYAGKASTVELNTEDQKAAYAIGSSLAQYLKANLTQQAEIGLTLDPQLVLAGVQDAFADQPKLTDVEAQTALQLLDQRVAELSKKVADEKAQVAIKQGQEFRDEFAKKEGVVVTDSGLMYVVETMGDGEKPTAEDTVVVHYKGTLPDGTQFDSSYDRNQPATFPLNRVIPGWTEGVQLMPVGSKFEFVIPSELAYGAQDTPTIPANSTLVFEVELLEIKKEDAPAAK